MTASAYKLSPPDADPTAITKQAAIVRKPEKKCWTDGGRTEVNPQPPQRVDGTPRNAQSVCL